VNALGQLDDHLKAKKYAELAQTLAVRRFVMLVAAHALSNIVFSGR
jgi:hypothetical protein